MLQIAMDLCKFEHEVLDEVSPDELARYLAHYEIKNEEQKKDCLLYTSPSPRDRQKSRMPSSA